MNVLRVSRRDRKERVRIVMWVRGAAFAYKFVDLGLKVGCEFSGGCDAVD